MDNLISKHLTLVILFRKKKKKETKSNILMYNIKRDFISSMRTGPTIFL